MNCNIIDKTNTNPHAQTNMLSKTNIDVHISYDDKTNLKDRVNTKTQANPSINIDMWTMFFDGSKSNKGEGVGCNLKDPKGKIILIACRLEFQCTNNIVEYKSLIQGLKKEVDMKVLGLLFDIHIHLTFATYIEYVA
jgi:hypothetical protein